MPRKIRYNKSEIVQALQSVGVNKGDIIFSHIGMGMIGYPEGSETEDKAFNVIYEAFMEAIGADGSLLIPTYSYSFCNGEKFNPETTPSQVGTFSEMFRKLRGVKRSLDPIFSVAGIGPKVDKLFCSLPPDCFGNDCIYQRLLDCGGKICNIGVGLRYATFVHHVEEMERVPYRFLKLFRGIMEVGSMQWEADWLYYVRLLVRNSEPDLRRLEIDAISQNKCYRAGVGLGEITCIDCTELYKLCSEGIAKDKWYLAEGPPEDPLVLERKRLPQKATLINLPADTPIKDILSALWRMPRDLVSDGHNIALDFIAKQIPMTINKYPTGTQCWNWIIPEKWTCNNAYLETMDGETIFSYDDNPLHVVSYSAPFKGVISKKKLLDHIFFHKLISNAIPYKHNSYNGKWGLCCSKDLLKSLTDERYRVKIESYFSYGTLNIGEVIIKGQSDTNIIFIVYLGHNGLASDGLSGVLVGIKLFGKLLNRNMLRYTYRLLIVPDPIAVIAFFSHNEWLIPKIKSVLFLEMVGLTNPHILNILSDRNADIDSILTLIMQHDDIMGCVGIYKTSIDQVMIKINEMNIYIPMLSLSRALSTSYEESPYPEYHTSFDTPNIVSIERLEESIKIVLEMIEWIENK